jgi:hypothetical protein
MRNKCRAEWQSGGADIKGSKERINFEGASQKRRL